MEGYFGSGFGASDNYEDTYEEPSKQLAKFENLKWYIEGRGILYSGDLFDEDMKRKDIIWVTNHNALDSFYKQGWNSISIQCEVLDYSDMRYKVVLHSITVGKGGGLQTFTYEIV